MKVVDEFISVFGQHVDVTAILSAAETAKTNATQESRAIPSKHFKPNPTNSSNGDVGPSAVGSRKLNLATKRSSHNHEKSGGLTLRERIEQRATAAGAAASA